MQIYVGNLPWGVASEDVKRLFEKHGQVESAQVMTDRETGRSRGFAFVSMPDEDARKAIEALDGSEIDGRKIVVNEARPRQTSGEGRGGFRSGGERRSGPPSGERRGSGGFRTGGGGYRGGTTRGGFRDRGDRDRGR